MMDQSKQSNEQQIGEYNHYRLPQQLDQVPQNPKLIDNHDDIIMNNKNYVDFMINTNDNITQLFTIISNEQYLEELSNDHDKNNSKNQTWNKNQHQSNYNINSNAFMMQILWNKNHCFDQDDLKKEEHQERWTQNRNLINIQEHYDDSISHFILQIDNNDCYLRFKSKNEKERSQIIQETLKTPAQIRRQKVQRYLQKKAKRSYSKKITYECRKLVADKRIRLKGRFINYHQAVSELGLNPQVNYEISYLKAQIKKLQENFHSNL